MQVPVSQLTFSRSFPLTQRSRRWCRRHLSPSSPHRCVACGRGSVPVPSQDGPLWSGPAHRGGGRGRKGRSRRRQRRRAGTGASSGPSHPCGPRETHRVSGGQTGSGLMRQHAAAMKTHRWSSCSRLVERLRTIKSTSLHLKTNCAAATGGFEVKSQHVDRTSTCSSIYVIVSEVVSYHFKH